METEFEAKLKIKEAQPRFRAIKKSRSKAGKVLTTGSAISITLYLIIVKSQLL